MGAGQEIITDKTVIDLAVEKLVNEGLKVDDMNVLHANLKDRHFSRYLKLLKFMKNYNIQPTSNNLYTIYRIDVNLRRTLLKYIKPMEVQISSSLSYYFEEINITLEEFINCEFAFDFETLGDDKSSLDKFEKKKKKLSKLFQGLYTKNPDAKQPWEIIDALTFTKKLRIIELMDPTEIKKMSVFKKVSKNEAIDIIDEIILLRNHITHFNILLSDDYINRKKASKFFKSCLQSLRKFARNDIMTNLHEDMFNYKLKLIDEFQKDSFMEQSAFASLLSKEELEANAYKDWVTKLETKTYKKINDLDYFYKKIYMFLGIDI